MKSMFFLIMKIKSWFIAGIASVLLASCAEEIINENTKYVCHHGLNIEVTDVGVTGTRANYSGFPETTFETGDAIGLYAFDGSTYAVSNMRFVKQSDGSWVADEEVPYNEDHTYYAYFPYRVTTYTPSTSGAVEEVDTKFDSFISDASNYFWQANQSTKAGFTYSNLMIAMGDITDIASDAVTVKFTMEHKRGLAVFTGEPAEATFTGNIPYVVGTTGQFLMKPNTSTSFTDDKGTYSLQAYAGGYVSHNIKGPVDLSMVDNAGEDRASRTTANCYLVHEAGKYKLPLVYGNAIKDGAVNEVAYYPGKNFSVEGGLNRFVNHNGDGIMGPWVTKNSSGVDAGMGLTAASAELLWQDVQGLITAVSIDGDFLKFTVGTFNPGNAVIAVKDGSGNILWSWHIWATEEDLTSTTSISVPGSITYRVASINLGWVPTGGSGKQGYCPYFQHGRKDPFIPARTYNTNLNHFVYDINDETVTGIRGQTSNATIADNIKNPTTFYNVSATNSSCNTTYYNMWDAQGVDLSSYNESYSSTQKTIYDPCPPGFCVPTWDLYNFMSTGNIRSDSNWDSSNLGKTWTLNGANVYFPASGARDQSGSLWVVGEEGEFWSVAGAEYNQEGRALWIGSDQWYADHPYRGYGFCVRPVVEEQQPTNYLRLGGMKWDGGIYDASSGEVIEVGPGYNPDDLSNLVLYDRRRRRIKPADSVYKSGSNLVYEASGYFITIVSYSNPTSWSYPAGGSGHTRKYEK